MDPFGHCFRSSLRGIKYVNEFFYFTFDFVCGTIGRLVRVGVEWRVPSIPSTYSWGKNFVKTLVWTFRCQFLRYGIPVSPYKSFNTRRCVSDSSTRRKFPFLQNIKRIYYILWYVEQPCREEVFYWIRSYCHNKIAYTCSKTNIVRYIVRMLQILVETERTSRLDTFRELLQNGSVRKIPL